MFSEIPRRLNMGARGLLQPALFAVLILADFPLSAEPSAEPIRAIRVWPAQDYTRVTVEYGQPLKHNLLRVRDPERLVLDLEDVDLQSVQQGFSDKISANDPYIANLRVGRFKPGVVRVVLDLKSEVKPQVASAETTVVRYEAPLGLLYYADSVAAWLAALLPPAGTPEATAGGDGW